MSFDEQPKILSALKTNPKLCQLVTGGFHNLKPNDVNAYPRIVYQEIVNRDKLFVDNGAVTSDVRFQISIFNTDENISSQTPIAKEVDKTLKSIGYSRYSSTDLYEEDDQVFHKSMRYQI